MVGRDLDGEPLARDPMRAEEEEVRMHSIVHALMHSTAQHQLASTNIVGVVDDLEVHAVHVERVRRGPEVVHDQVQQRRARGARHVRRCSHRACSSGTSVNQRVTQRASPSARRGLAARHGIRCSKRSGG